MDKNYEIRHNSKWFFAIDRDFSNEFFAHKKIIGQIIDILNWPILSKKEILDHQLAYIYDKNYIVNSHYLWDKTYIEDISQLSRWQSHHKLLRIYHWNHAYLAKKLKKKTEMAVNQQLEHNALQEFEWVLALQQAKVPVISPLFCYSSSDNTHEYIVYPLIKSFETLEERFRYRDHDVWEKLYQEITNLVDPIKNNLEERWKYLADVNGRNIRVHWDDVQKKFEYQLFDVLLLNEKPRTFYYGDY